MLLKLKHIAPNFTSVELHEDDRKVQVYFSYETPVALLVESKRNCVGYKLDGSVYSKTTKRHTNTLNMTYMSTVDLGDFIKYLNRAMNDFLLPLRDHHAGN